MTDRFPRLWFLRLTWTEVLMGIWEGDWSPRYLRITNINSALPSTKFFKLTGDLREDKLVLLFNFIRDIILHTASIIVLQCQDGATRTIHS